MGMQLFADNGAQLNNSVVTFDYPAMEDSTARIALAHHEERANQPATFSPRQMFFARVFPTNCQLVTVLPVSPSYLTRPIGRDHLEISSSRRVHVAIGQPAECALPIVLRVRKEMKREILVAVSPLTEQRPREIRSAEGALEKFYCTS